MFIASAPGVNFTNVLLTAFTLFTLLGSARVKAVRIALMKLRIGFINRRKWRISICLVIRSAG
jgi:hypothetical protein